MATAKPIRFLSAWFCPFAHRTHIALEHLKVPYEYVEALGWEQRADGVYHHCKTDELAASNPNGTVPALLLDGDPKGRTVHESLVSLEYLNDRCGGGRLLDRDPYAAAAQRVEADFVNRRLCSPYYQVLVRRDEAERRQHFDELLASLRDFSARIRGPFVGGAALSLVDCALLPHAYRYYVLEHYRGPAFAVPRDDPSLAPFHAWLEHMVALPSVAATLPDKDRYLAHASKYAHDRARSLVAEAVRAGKAAHDM